MLEMIDRLRTLMGDAAFEEEAQRGALLQAAAEERAEKARIEAMEAAKTKIDAEAARTVREQDEDETYGGPNIEVEYADMTEIHKMLKAGKTEKHLPGELAPAGSSFCPILAIAKFPYKYMTPQSKPSELVSKKFFANERFWDIEWTLFFIYPPVSLSTKPIILVPAEEVRSFLSKVNKSLKMELSLDKSSRQTGLLLDFPGDGTPRPRYLGLSFSRSMFATYERSVPKMPEEASDVEASSLAAWKKVMETAIEATKPRKPKKKAKKERERNLAKSSWARQLRRLQRYLGLREGNDAERKDAYFLANTGEEQEASSNAQALAKDFAHQPVDTAKQPQFPFDLDIVLVAIDVEVYEHNHDQVTEVGIASLDTSLLAGKAPGKDGSSWISLVKGRHFIIKEYAHLVNSKFISGCPERFEEDFGKSEKVSLSNLREMIVSCIRVDGDNGRTRNVVLVGHDIDSDIGYLRAIELDIAASDGVIELLDTAHLYQSLRCDEQPSKLASILYDFGITGWNLHNAGNDACYTLQALLAIAVRSLSPEKPSLSAEKQAENLEDEVEELARVRESTAQRSLEQDEGGSDDNDEGGVRLDATENQASAEEDKAFL